MTQKQLHASACLGFSLLFLLWLAPQMEASTLFGKKVVGKEKAEIFISDDWTVAQVSPGLGPHQWMRGTGQKQSVIVVEEVHGLFMEEGDFVSALSMSAERLRLNMTKGAKASEVTFQQRKELGKASASVTGKIDGDELQFEFRLVGTDGLGYQVLVWSSKRNGRNAKKYADLVADSLVMPGPKSQWRRGLKAKTYTKSVNGQRISIAAAPSILGNDNFPGDSLMGLTSAGDEFAAYLFEHRYGDSLDAVLDEQAEYTAGDLDELVPLRRASVEIGGRPARVASYLGRTGEQEIFVESYVTEGGPNGMIELRMLSSGADGAHSALRESLVSSLQITALSEMSAFPVVDGPRAWPGDEPPYAPDPDLARLHSISTEHMKVQLASEYISSIAEDDGGLLLSTSQEAQRFDFESSELVEIFNQGDSGHQITTTRLGTKVYTTIDGELCRVEDGLVAPMDVKASSVVAYGDKGLLLHRDVVSPHILGFQYSSPTDSQLVLRSRSGSEQVAYSSHHRRIVEIAAHGEHVILELADHNDGSSDVDVMVIELGADAHQVKVEKWRDVASIVPAPDGWLITGRPLGGTPGSYLMGTDGARRRILDHMRVQVLGISPDQRLYYFGSRYGPREEWFNLRSVPLADLEKAALFQAPWSAVDLGELAREAQPKEGLTNTGEAASKRWMPFLERANRLSLKRFGCDFPIEPDAVDSLVDLLAGSSLLDEDGRQLLVAIVIRALANQGAVWALAPSSVPTGASPGNYAVSNELRTGINVASAVLQVGSPDSEAYSIVGSTLKALDGRELLIGTDSGALHRAVAAGRNPLIEIRFDEVRLEDLQELTDASPTNEALRTFVYRHLVLNHRQDVLVALATHHASQKHANATDMVLAIEGRELTKASADKAIDDLKDAIERFPYVADLYILLGEAYEAQRAKDYKDLAYACFAHADSMLYSGPAMERAQAGLDRTGDS